jgi:hypothetical protein
LLFGSNIFGGPFFGGPSSTGNTVVDVDVMYDVMYLTESSGETDEQKG